MTFSSGDQVTLTFTAISVSGGLTANGTDFINGNGGSNITFGSTATLAGGTNTFDLPIYVPYTLVPSLAGNTSFGQVYIEAGTISSGTLALNLIGNNANMSYVFASAFTVAAGATMAVGPNVIVLANSESTFSDAGAMTFSSGDQVTLTFTAISVSGGLTANGTDFINGNGGNITFGSTATLAGGTNTFGLPIYVPYTLVPSLAGNTSFGQVYIEAGTISSGTLALNLIGNNANMSYVFASAFTVAAGATMAVGPNVIVLANSESTFSDAGAMTFSSGDQVTLTYTALSVSGSLTVNGTTFINGGSAVIVVNSGGDLMASGSTFSLQQLDLTSGSTDNLQYVAFDTQLAINSGATIDITSDDFTNGTVVASGTASATISLDQQFLGHDQSHADRGQDHGSRQ